ncbi:MAG: hypothetical protein ACYSOT_09745 [Planctomycetota bacterium]|jgi:hypothetical protein
MLGEIIDFIYERKFIIGLILIALFFISIAVYVYFNNIKPGLNKQFVENREFVSEDQDQNREPKVATLLIVKKQDLLLMNLKVK